ncbi:MAG: efflux RND transporter permease subunit [Planctomycetes bacterium]|nr:efflux RND transporter permease subunit [Planctomycetota bacterium]
MKSLLALAARNNVFANLLLICILAAGGLAAAGLIRELLPIFTADAVRVEVVYPGATPEEVEEGICLKIEEAIEGIEGVKEYYTVANEGVASAVIEMEEDVSDPRKVQNDIRDRVEAIKTYPLDAEKPITTEILLRRRVINVSLSGTASEEVLKEYAETIKDELVAEPGISQVEIVGVRQPEIAIEVAEDKLRAFGLSFDQVAAVVRRAALNLSGGTIRSRHGEIKIRAMGRRYRADEFADIVVLAAPDGALVRLGDIADLRDTFEEITRYGAQDGKRAVLLGVYKTEEEDAIDISRRVRAYVDRKNPSLPGDLHLFPWYDTSKFIGDRLSLLVRNGRQGLALVFLSLWILLGFRLAFWVALGIPVSFAGALAIMAATGQTLNMISLFGLIMTLGIIVDDAIIVGESIAQARERGLPPLAAAVAGVREVAWPVLAAVTTTIVAFLPLFFVKGVMGKFISVLPAVVVAALAVSLIESLFLLPAHLNHLPAPHVPDPRAAREVRVGWRRAPASFRRAIIRAFAAFIDRIYRPLAYTSLRGRYVTLAGMFAIFAIAVGTVLGGHLKFVFFPRLDSELIVASVEFPAGTPADVTQREVDRIAEAIRAMDEEERRTRGHGILLTAWASIGSTLSARPSLAPPGDNQGGVLVQLVPTEERRMHSEKIIQRWRAAIGTVPDALALTVESEGGGPGGAPIEIRLLGHDMDQLVSCARGIQTALSSYTGVEDIADDFRPGKQELRVRLRPPARTLGITFDDVARQLRQGWYGDEALRIQRGRDDVRVKVRYPEDERRSLGELDAVRIRAPDGREIPFREVAEAKIDRGYASIVRQGGLRRVVVTADVDETRANAREVLGRFESDEMPRILAAHEGVSYSLEGQNEETQRALGSLRQGFVFAALGIFLIVAATFRSYAQTLVILFTIPMGFVGAVIGHLVMGYDLSMMSLFGLVTLAGIVVNDAIVLTERFNENIAEGMPFLPALAEAGCRRFRAIFLTTITTAFGLLPLILERSLQAQYLIPMAVSLAFGVAFATILTLFAVPALIAVLNDLRRFAAWLRSGESRRPEEVEPALGRRAGEAFAEPGEVATAASGADPMGGAAGGMGRTLGILVLAAAGIAGIATVAGCRLAEPRPYDPAPAWRPEEAVEIPARDQVVLPAVLSLEGARRLAAEGSPTLASSFARIEAARARVAQARSAYLPRVDANASFQHIYEVPGIRRFPWLPDEYDTYAATLDATWVIFDGFAREFRVAAARWAERESRAAHEDGRRLLLSAVDRAYHDAQLAAEGLRIAAADEKYNADLAEDTRKRQRRGAASETDALNFEVRAQAARGSVISARKALATRRIILAELIGLPGALLPETTSLEPLGEEMPDLLAAPEAARWIEIARAARPDLARSAYTVERSRAETREAASAWLPSLVLSGTYGRQRVGNIHFTPDDATASLLIGLGWNLFAGGERLASLRGTRAALRGAQADLDRQALAVASEIRQAVTAVAEAQEQLAVARTSRELAQRSRDLVRRAYEAGQEPLTRLNEVQRDFVQAEARLASARIQLRAAWSQLRTASGADPRAAGSP